MKKSWIAKDLLQKRMWVDTNDYAALHACVENDAVEVAKLLLDGGMDYERYRQQYPASGSEETIQALVEHWQTIQEQNQELEQEDGPEPKVGMTFG